MASSDESTARLLQRLIIEQQAQAKRLIEIAEVSGELITDVLKAIQRDKPADD